MTTKEKIEALDNLIGMVDDNHGTDYDEALKSAKRSLEAWDNVKTNGDAIKMVFPNMEIARIQANCVIIWIDKPWIKCEISNHWWNAKYKGVE